MNTELIKDIKNELTCISMIINHQEFKNLEEVPDFDLKEMLKNIEEAYTCLRVAELHNPKCTTYTVGCRDCTKD